MRIIQEQLSRACKMTGAAWAAYFERIALDWEVRFGFRVQGDFNRSLENFLADPEHVKWMAASLSSARTRSRGSGGLSEELRCKRLYVFPAAHAQGVFLVGADKLTTEAKKIFRLVAIGLERSRVDDETLEHRPPIGNLEFEGEVTYDFQGGLRRVLSSVGESLPSNAAYLAIRRGDVFRVEGSWNCSPEIHGMRVTTSKHPILTAISTSREARCISDVGSVRELVPQSAFPETVRTWLGVPLVLGNRVIALLAFVGYQQGAFSDNEMQRAMHFAKQITPFVENAIAFAEAGRHLQRLALLNELASAASAGMDIDEVANRVLRMLRRTFHTDLIALLMLSDDGRWLKEYGESSSRSSMVVSVKNSLAGYVVETGLPVRVDDLIDAPKFLPTNPGVRAELSVPLKYRGKVNGVMSLGSMEPNAFSVEDEQLLVVIASNLAGLLENVRLSEVSRLRARNLELIHQVVQRVVGLTEVDQIARLSAELMAERFGYELATVMVVSKREDELEIRGVGGTVSHLVKRAATISLQSGIFLRVIETGASYMANNITKKGRDLRIPNWKAKSQMSVPLREGDLVFGLIDVESSSKNAFSENDLLVLESLAGFLSSVMMNARRYQQLQSSVRNMQAGRETALDIGADLDLDTLLRRVVNRAKALVGVKGAELGLVDEEEGVVRVFVSENPWNDYSGFTFPLMTGVAGRVAALGEPLVVNDYNAWSGKMQPGRQAPFNSVAGVPLKFKGQVIGTLTVYDDHPDHEINSEDVELLEVLAPQVAVYIRHATLYQELQERIEAQQLAENRLIQSARLAAVGEMAAGIAHELNNPLTTIAGFAELMLDELEVEFAQRPDLELILRESIRARSVVRRLLDFSRQSESMREFLDLNAVVRDVVALVLHLARTSGVDVKTELAANLPRIYIDGNQLKQVLLNLVHNALQAMPTGGTVYLSSKRQEREGQSWVTISVRDTGEGIPSDYLGRIFEPFFTTKPTGSGTGLGLSISYGIIADHGGYIDVESDEGQGSEFTIWLSAEEEHVGV